MAKWLLFVFMVCGSMVYGQEYTPAFFSVNGTPAHGVKIKTTIPFQSGQNMPTIMIEGYNYSKTKTIGVLLSFYVHGSTVKFVRPTASSYGAHMPPIKLANEGGFVVIFLDERQYFERFMVRAFGDGLGGEVPASYENWTVVDEPLTGTRIVDVPYKSRTWDVKGVNTFLEEGNIGIGTQNPADKLHVKGGIRMQSSSGGTSWRFVANSNSSFSIKQNGAGGTVNLFPSGNANVNALNITDGKVGLWTTSPRSRLELRGDFRMRNWSSDKSWQMLVDDNERFTIFESDNGPAFTIHDSGPANDNLFHIVNGRVGIGTASPDAKLTVNGKIISEEVKVEIVNGPDYVFEPSYELRTLADVRAYIDAYGHLPEVPSAEMMETEGVNVGEMNMLLLKKVEELTLYAIDQQTQLRSQEARIEYLQRQLEQVEQLRKELASIRSELVERRKED